MDRLQQFNDRTVFLLAVIASALISVWCASTDNVVDSDTVINLQAARQLAQGELGTALSLHQWPFFAASIGLLSTISGAQVEVSLYVINAVLATLVVVSFMAVTREFGGDRTTLAIAALVVLLFPEINHQRTSATGDLGYLAFYLLALLVFIRYSQQPSIRCAVGSLIALGISSLFRLEAIGFLCLLFIFPRRGAPVGWTKKITLAALATCCLAVVVIGSLWWSWSQATLDAGPVAALDGAWQQLGTEFADKITAIRRDYLGSFSGEYAHAVIILALAVIVVVETLSRLTPLHSVLVGHAVYRKLTFPHPGTRTLWHQLIAINLFIASVMIATNLFSIHSYPLSLPITLLLAVPFSLTRLYDHWLSNRDLRAHTWTFPIVMMLFVITAAKSLDTFSSRGYLKEAGLWLKHNAPTHASLYSNNPIVGFYAGKSYDHSVPIRQWSDTIKMAIDENWRKYDFLAVHIKRSRRYRESRLLNSLKLEPLRVFESNQGDRVLLFATAKD